MSATDKRQGMAEPDHDPPSLPTAFANSMPPFIGHDLHAMAAEATTLTTSSSVNRSANSFGGSAAPSATRAIIEAYSSRSSRNLSSHITTRCMRANVHT